MSGGVFAISRNIFEHDVFDDEPFTQREAWIWLIKEAAWKDRRIRIGANFLNLKRGQCTYSVRYLADRWQWSKSRVDRFLSLLRAENMIGTASGTVAGQSGENSGTVVGRGQLVITICNYDEYQKVSLPEKDGSGTVAGQSGENSGTVVGTKQNTGIRNNKNIPFGTNVPQGPLAATEKSLEAEVYAVGKSILGKSAGGVITKLRKVCEYEDTVALEWLRKAADKENPTEWIHAVMKATGNRVYVGVLGAPQPPADMIIESREDREWRKREAEIYRGLL